nr:hypothetical protein [Tanacetum cinerariifolium]
LPAAASPTTDSPGYIPEFDPDEDPEDDDDEDPKEDLADYPADHDDDEEEEPFGNDADEEDEEQDEDDDDEEEEHPTLADSIPPPPALRVTATISLGPQPPTLSFTNQYAERADRPEVTLPPQKRLGIVHCLGYKAGESSVAATARPIEGRRADYGFVDSVEAEIRRRRVEDVRYGIIDTWIDPGDVAEEGRQTEIFQRVEALVDDRQYHYETGRLVDQEARFSREACAHSIGLGSAVHFELQGYMTHTWVQDQHIDAQDTLIATLTTQLSSLQGHLATDLGEIRALQAREQARAASTVVGFVFSFLVSEIVYDFMKPNGCYLSCDLKKMAPKQAAPKRTTRLNPGATPNLNSAPSTTTITVTNAQLYAMIDQGVNTALAARDANRTGDDNHTSGMGVRRTERVTRECTYQDFIKCQPL